MRFKAMRLMVICNGLKWTISVSGRLELLQIVLELDIGQFTREDVGLP